MTNTRMKKTPKGREVEVTIYTDEVMFGFVRARDPETNWLTQGLVKWYGLTKTPSEQALYEAEQDALIKMDFVLDQKRYISKEANNE